MPQVFPGSSSYLRPSVRPVLTIGNFDGLHWGHQHLLEKVVARAKALSVPACVYTFDPPPRVVLAPGQARPRILAWPDKVRLLGALGIDHVVVERFTRSFAQHPPDWFASEVLGRRLAPSAMFVGYDFRFGKARGGDVSFLRRVLPDLEVVQVSALEKGDRVVSSSAIRELVGNGDVAQAASLLSRPYWIRGVVVAGDRRGRTLGFRTANLDSDAELLPASGVYAVRARVDGGAWMPAVANLGTRPTFDGERFLVEVHILDGSHDLYGRELLVSFHARIRGEQAFDGPDALVRQIRKDVELARKSLASSEAPSA